MRTSDSDNPPGSSDDVHLGKVAVDSERSHPELDHDPSQVPLPPSPTLGGSQRFEDPSQNSPRDAELPEGLSQLPGSSTNDVLREIPNLFRLLDLYQENGSGGLVEKVLIDQASLRDLLNTLLPGSYDSVSRINFKALDDLTIQPLGVYGSKLEIINFLQQVNFLNEESKNALSAAIASSNDLRSGLYLALPQEPSIAGSVTHGAYIIYWPEDSTWEDKAISSVCRNRVTFMRYLSKLADQIVALVSPEQAAAFVWTSGARNVDTSEDQLEEFDDSRMFSFEVAKSHEQEEDAIASEGFTVPIDTRKLPKTKNASYIGLVPGEEKAGLLVSGNEPARQKQKPLNETMFPKALQLLIKSTDSPIVLGELSAKDILALGENGLEEKYPEPFSRYRQRMQREANARSDAYKTDVRIMNDRINQDRPKLQQLLTFMVWRHFRDTYPSIEGPLSPSGSDAPDSASLRSEYPPIDGVPADIKERAKINTVNDTTFKNLKFAWHVIRDFLAKEPNASESSQVDFVKKVLGAGNNEEGWQTVTKDNQKKHGSLWQKVKGFKDAIVNLLALESIPSPVEELSDPEFIAALQPLALKHSAAVSELTQRITSCVYNYLRDSESRLTAEYLKELTEGEASRLTRLFNELLLEQGKEDSKAAGLDLLKELKQLMPLAKANFTRIDSVESVDPAWHTRGYKYHVRGEETFERKARTRYLVRPFELTEHDAHQCRSNSSYRPTPKLGITQVFEFFLGEGRKIKFLQFVREKCLVIVAEPRAFHLYIEDNVHLAGSIAKATGKQVFNYDRLGKSCIFAFDQTTRLLAIFHQQKDPMLSIYGFDETFSSIRGRGSPLPLKGWYDTEVQIQKMCFVSGAEEICLVESSGRARILSLITQQFRPATIQINGRILDMLSTPDGSCLLVSVIMDESSSSSSQQTLLAFHWASFGSNQSGISATILPDSNVDRIVTSFEGRNRIHVLSFSSKTGATTSTALQIKQKISEFSFRSNDFDSGNTITETTNNSLIDCHRDVWTRYPVLPAVSRATLSPLGREPRKLLFISAAALDPLGQYFERMIATFEQTTRKPMDASVASLSVVVSSDSPDKVARRTACSRYKLGSFVVELLCLIPLHLAITRDNRFIPLKDGVWDPLHERSLLGADVPSIIDSLSIGWYESLFQSYMATKPVRVVSSMGEQSVGKSYCLNHFADTTFAGSAMRTTEGVWLSCTPTDNYLLVSLDFEGVHSIERSAQEDALLVLFNTAISNLVLFRNNFALSRDIAGLFTSFQSSAMVLDPRANPTLFNSTLAIIIKDVTDSDKRDIVKEFSLKFQGIVQKEQEQNFISRLHRGKIQIIPWPVINSPGFYTLFRQLRQYLDKQPVTHQSGGVFLHNLKTLMAKIKASDWGSLDQNLITHRALQIGELLHGALSRGCTEQGVDTWGPLKNLDTDEDLTPSEIDAVFFVPETTPGFTPETELDAEESLRNLTGRFSSDIGTRQTLGDAQFMELLQTRIFDSLDQRLEHVRHWFVVNMERFPPENQEIRNIRSKIDSAALAMRAVVRFCAETCSCCQLLCVRPHRHSAPHDCGTTHRCTFSCEIIDEHIDPVDCGLPAGHTARHMCDVKAHSCGHDCSLIDKSGCTKACIKPLDHAGEHLCSTRSHLCGEPCSLRDVNSSYQCPGRCHVPWDEPHTRHSCNKGSSCPIECRLCPRLCCEPDHFHGMEVGAVHLCGQEHSCASLCDAEGICRIETQPSAVTEQFTGRHEAFQYTRYSQVAQRLGCAVPVPPGELQHIGPHTHSTGNDTFHFCDVRCPSCDYVCTLPLGHPQQLHETSHGSMIATQWVIEGTDSNAVYELNGRKFGTGDEGAPMLCHLVCADQGRHAHIDFCRDADNCGGAELEHINDAVCNGAHRAKDWISHRLKWARSGFQDPYSREQQAEFAKCDALCAGPEHEANAGSAGKPSYCTLPIFHPPRALHPAPTSGYVSTDGHAFDCQNPARLHQSYHIVFVIDSSGSMTWKDRAPLTNTPVSAKLRSACNNRYGAVLSALYGFWISRDTISSNAQSRQDAYTVVTFDRRPTTRVSNDFTSTTDELIDQLLPQLGCHGTNFAGALAHAQTLIRSCWSSERAPVLVFLSDGECTIGDDPVHDLCTMCIQLGKPLAFYSVSFGSERYSASLRQMANVAREVYQRAPLDPLTTARGNPCSYANAIDSIQLADTFLGISGSLQRPRASLIGQSVSRRVVC